MSIRLIAIVAFAAAAVAVSPGSWEVRAQENAPGVDVKKFVPKNKSTSKIKVEKDEIVRFRDKLTTADPFDRTRSRCYSKSFTKQLVAGKAYRITLNHLGGTGNDPYLRIETSDGVQVAQNDDFGGTLNSQIVMNCTFTGDYKLIATSCGAEQTFDFELIVEPLPPGTVVGTTYGGPAPTQYFPQLFGDLEITAEPNLAANLDPSELRFGYIEYRFTINNHSVVDAHTVTLTIPKDARFGRSLQYISALSRTVVVDPERTVRLSIFQPDVPLGGYVNNVRVSIDGREQEGGLNCNLYRDRDLTYSSSIGPRSPILASTEAFDAGIHSGVTIWFEQKRRKADPKLTGGPIHQSFSVHRGSRPVEDWSSSWLSYTSFPGVAVMARELDAAPPGVQSALFQYVECGGGLVVGGVPKSLPTGWSTYKSEPDEGQVVYSPGFGRCFVLADANVNHPTRNGLPILEAWENTYHAFDQCVNATDANRQFPVVETSGIPVRGLFAFMFAFVLVIGPLNLYWLSRIKRRIWLLWTVPAIALLTSSLMFGYMAVTEGWRPHARVMGITILDQNSQRAATIGWLGIYSPTTPGGGLVFSPSTELSPHFGNMAGPRYGRGDSQPMSMNWTHGQHLEAGWVTAKIPVHFLTRRNDRVQSRLTIRGPANAPIAVNTLGCDIEKLTFADANGDVWSASNIVAGQEAPLAAAGKKAEGKLDDFNQGFAKNWIRFADTIAAEPHQYLRANMYLAVAAEPAFLEIGLEQTQTLNARSLIVGVLKNE